MLRLFAKEWTGLHWVKIVCIWSFSGPHFPAFRLNTERYGVSLRIQSECRKIPTTKTPNTDIFYAVLTICCFGFHILIQWCNLLPSNKWVKVFKNGPSKICGRQLLKSLRWYGLPKHFKIFKGYPSQILLGPFLNTFSHMPLLTIIISPVLKKYYNYKSSVEEALWNSSSLSNWKWIKCSSYLKLYFSYNYISQADASLSKFTISFPFVKYCSLTFSLCLSV